MSVKLISVSLKIKEIHPNKEVKQPETAAA
jgi:hypothetical protein